MADRIQQRRDTAARWASFNPILLEGEIGWVIDNPNQYKIGDGVNAWNSLPLRGYSGTVASTIGTDETAVLSQAATSKLTGLTRFLLFSTSKDYKKGRIVNYEGILYRFTADHPAGAWVGTDVVESSLKEAVDQQFYETMGADMWENGYYITKTGIRSTTTNLGFSATNYLPISGTEDIVVQGGWLSPGGDIVPIAFYYKDKVFISSYSTPENTDEYFTVKASDIPVGARYIQCTANIIRGTVQAQFPRIVGVDYMSMLGLVNETRDDLLELTKIVSEDGGFSCIPLVIPNYILSTSSGVSKWMRTQAWDVSLTKIFDGSKKLTVQGIPINSNILVIFFKDLNTDDSNYISAAWINASSPVVTSGTISIPAEARLAVIDIPKANYVEEDGGYRNFRVIQEGAGASQALVAENKKTLSGYFFTIKDRYVVETGGIRGSNGLDSTPLLPITGKMPIRLQGGWRNAASQITPIAFYDAQQQFLSCYMGDIEPNNTGVYEYAVADIPAGAAYIRCCVNVLRWGVDGCSLYGVDLASLACAGVDYFNWNQSQTKDGSFSGEPNVVLGYLVSSSAGLYGGYMPSEIWDCSWTFLYKSATTLKCEGAIPSFVAWFNSNYPSEETFISFQSWTGESMLIPAGAKLAIIDYSKANNSEGYSNLIVTQDGFGAFRKEDLEDVFYGLGLITYKDGDSIDTGATVDGYQKPGGDVLLTSDYVHQNVVIPDYTKRYHVVINRWPQASDNIVFMVAFNSEGRPIQGMYPNPVPGYGLNEIVKFPIGTAKVAINWRFNYAPAPTVKIAIAENIDIKEMQEEVDKHDEILRQKTYTPVEKVSEVRGQFIQENGTPKANGSFFYARYDITDINLDYRLTSGYGSNTGISFAHYYDENDVQLGTEYYVTTPAGGSYQLDRAELHLPAGTAYILANCSNLYTQKLEIMTEGDYYDLSQIGKETSGLMKVHIYGLETSLGYDLFYVRTKYNKARTKDIIMLYYTNDNGLISPKSAYVGPSELTDAQLMTSTYLQTTHSDSTAPFFQSSVYWHLYAQHGYIIPYIANSNNMVTADIGAIWKDQLDRQFVIGNVTANNIYLLPIFDTSGGEGHDSRNWQTPLQTAVNALTHVSGGTTTTPITGATQSTVQLRPIMQSYNRKYMIDGNMIAAEGDHWCDDFQVSESQIGYDPSTVAQNNWFPTPGVVGTPNLEGALELARFTWSYNFKGSTVCVNTTVDVRRKIECQSYGASQQQFFFDKGNYKAMFMIPKAAAQSGVEIDKPFNSPSTSSRGYSYYRNATYLKDVDKLIDRQIGFLQDPNADDYLIGMAAGLSLVSGDTVEEKRRQNIPIATDTGNGHQRLGSFSPSNTNKFYIAAVNTAPFADDGYNFPNTYFKEINYYVSYFDPSDNVGQVYWYKDGEQYVIYAHCQSVQSRIGINVPDFMEGLGLEIVEQTDGAQLLTSTIQNGQFFVNYNTDEANYIVLKTK